MAFVSARDMTAVATATKISQGPSGAASLKTMRAAGGRRAPPRPPKDCLHPNTTHSNRAVGRKAAPLIAAEFLHVLEEIEWFNLKVNLAPTVMTKFLFISA